LAQYLVGLARDGVRSITACIAGKPAPTGPVLMSKRYFCQTFDLNEKGLAPDWSEAFFMVGL
jgi:hypothetical protein